MLKYRLILKGTVSTQLLGSVLNWRRCSGLEEGGRTGVSWCSAKLSACSDGPQSLTVGSRVLPGPTALHCQNFHPLLLTRQSWRWGASPRILSPRRALTELRKMGFWGFDISFSCYIAAIKKVTTVFLSSLRIRTSNSRSEGLPVMPNLVAYLVKVAMRDSEP